LTKAAAWLIHHISMHYWYVTPSVDDSSSLVMIEFDYNNYYALHPRAIVPILPCLEIIGWRKSTIPKSLSLWSRGSYLGCFLVIGWNRFSHGPIAGCLTLWSTSNDWDWACCPQAWHRYFHPIFFFFFFTPKQCWKEALIKNENEKETVWTEI